MNSPALNPRPACSVLVINNLKIKKSSFQPVGRLLRKIDKLEERLAAYHTHDLKRFEEWCESTFVEERRKITATKALYEERMRFHEAVSLTADMLGIGLAAAFRLAKEERKQYAAGPHDVRAKIEERGQVLADFARKQQVEPQPHGFCSEPTGDHWREDILERLYRMPDASLEKACLAKETAFQLLELCDEAGVPELFFRVWTCMPLEFQNAYDQKNQAPADCEKLKQLYRKLVRRLHPDVRASEAKDGTGAWQERLWTRVQKAYNQQDYEGLERLQRITLLRQRAFNDLTLGEIGEGCLWLEGERKALEEEVRGLRTLPAWGFARRRQLGALRKRVRRELLVELRGLREQLRELESFHKALARASRKGAPLGPLFAGVPR